MAMRKALPLIGAVAVLIALFAASALAPAAPPPGGKMNVVLISIDSLRADHMGLYGYERDTTPNVDDFAKSAAVFENYFSTSHLTPISAGSVHTGAHPLRSGMVNFTSRFRDDLPTIAETLRADGYRTATFGSSPEFGFPILKDEFSRGFDAYDPSVLPPSIESSTNFIKTAADGRGTIPVNEATEWMRAAAQDEKPFFLWMPLGSVHWPYGLQERATYADRGFDGRFNIWTHSARYPQQHLFGTLYGRVYDGKFYGMEGAVLDDDLRDEFAHLVDTYDDGVRETDRQLRPLLSLLSSSAFRDNTIVIIESEHGEDLGEHGYVAHYDLHGTETHVPLIIRAPGIEAQRVADLASGVDVAPTLYALLGKTLGSPDGVSFAERLTGDEAPRDAVFMTRTPLWERVLATIDDWYLGFVKEDDARHAYDTAIRTDEWLLIHRLARSALREYSWYGRLTGTPVELPEYELYKVSEDPFETTNLYASEPEVAHGLRTRLLEWEQSMTAVAPPEEPTTVIQPYF